MATLLTRRHRMPFGAELVDSGARFRLWAPAAQSVHVEVERTRGERSHTLPLRPAGTGWFELVTQAAATGSRYTFILDGRDRVADPASRFQPDGVHGSSELIDPAAYAWSASQRGRRAWHELVFYELHVGTFTDAGTYRAAIERLNELEDLGITALELMPLWEAPGARSWGYDGVLPYAPESAYGRPEDLKALIEAAHARGLAVFLDVVYNHFGPEGNALHRYAPHFFSKVHATPWGPALDFESALEVREFFVHNALYWTEEFDIDGLRLDAVHAIVDGSRPHVLTEIATRLVREGVATGDGRAYAVLENDNNSARLLRSYAAQWDDDIHHSLHVLITGEHDGYYADYADAPARHLGRALTEGFAFQGEASLFRGGPRRGEPSRDLPPTSFVTFLQNHDQVGNRAFGERIGQLAAHDRVRAGAAIVLLAPSLPLVFMGEEWSASSPFLFFCDFEPELARLVREGRRSEFAAFDAFVGEGKTSLPDPCAEQTYARSKLRWAERATEPHRSMLELYRAALRVRRERIVPMLARRRVDASYSAGGDGCTALTARWSFRGGAMLSLAANLSDSAVNRADLAPHDERNAAAIFVVGPRRGMQEIAADTLGAWTVEWRLRP